MAREAAPAGSGWRGRGRWLRRPRVRRRFHWKGTWAGGFVFLPRRRDLWRRPQRRDDLDAVIYGLELDAVIADVAEGHGGRLVPDDVVARDGS